MRLKHKDLQALEHAILELNRCQDIDSFHRAVPRILQKLFDGDYPKQSNRKRSQSKQQFSGGNATGSQRILARPVIERRQDRSSSSALQGSGPPASCRLVNLALNWAKCRLGFDHRIKQPIGRSCGSACARNLGRKCRDRHQRNLRLLHLIQPHFDQAQENIERIQAAAAHRAIPLSAYGLSPRETEVASWLANGKSNPEIALILRASARTVEKHMERVLQKLGVENRTMAALALAQYRPHP